MRRTKYMSFTFSCPITQEVSLHLRQPSFSVLPLIRVKIPTHVEDHARDIFLPFSLEMSFSSPANKVVSEIFNSLTTSFSSSTSLTICNTSFSNRVDKQGRWSTFRTCEKKPNGFTFRLWVRSCLSLSFTLEQRAESFLPSCYGFPPCSFPKRLCYNVICLPQTDVPACWKLA